jgi:hypothetical protein
LAEIAYVCDGLIQESFPALLRIAAEHRPRFHVSQYRHFGMNLQEMSTRSQRQCGSVLDGVSLAKVTHYCPVLQMTYRYVVLLR